METICKVSNAEGCPVKDKDKWEWECMAGVKEIYDELVKSGYTQKDAAKEAQKRTGFAVVTQKPIKSKQLKFSKEGVTYGQQKSLKKFQGGNLKKFRPYG
jgi:hypothetical protein